MAQFLNIKQLAKTFGVSERHLYRQKAAGRFPPSVRIGGCHRWELEEFRKHFLEGKNRKPNQDQRGQ